VHLFTLATMVVCFAADYKHITVKISVSFFAFRVIQRNTRSGKTIYQIYIPPKKKMTFAIAIVNKNLLNHTVSLVPLNGRIFSQIC